MVGGREVKLGGSKSLKVLEHEMSQLEGVHNENNFTEKIENKSIVIIR